MYWTKSLKRLNSIYLKIHWNKYSTTMKQLFPLTKFFFHKIINKNGWSIKKRSGPQRPIGPWRLGCSNFCSRCLWSFFTRLNESSVNYLRQTKSTIQIQASTDFALKSAVPSSKVSCIPSILSFRFTSHAILNLGNFNQTLKCNIIFIVLESKNGFDASKAGLM